MVRVIDGTYIEVVPWLLALESQLRYETTCKKVGQTWCNLWFQEHRDELDELECHECVLQSEQMWLSHPAGYEAFRAEEFASLTASCASTTGYAVQTPTAVRLNGYAWVSIINMLDWGKLMMWQDCASDHGDSDNHNHRGADSYYRVRCS